MGCIGRLSNGKVAGSGREKGKENIGHLVGDFRAGIVLIADFAMNPSTDEALFVPPL